MARREELRYRRALSCKYVWKVIMAIGHRNYGDWLGGYDDRMWGNVQFGDYRHGTGAGSLQMVIRRSEHSGIASTAVSARRVVEME